MKDFDVRKLIRPDILELPGYVPITPTDVLAERLGIAPERVLKLDGNENPYGPSPRARGPRMSANPTSATPAAARRRKQAWLR